VQKTSSELEYTGKKKQAHRDRFLADLEQLVPLAETTRAEKFNGGLP